MANEDLKSIGKSAGIIASVIAVAALLKNKFKTPIPPKSIPTELLLYLTMGQYYYNQTAQY